MRNTDYNYELFVDAKTKFDVARKTACSEFILKQTQDLNTSEARDFWGNFQKMFETRKTQQIGPFLNDNNEYLFKDPELEEELFSTFFQGKHISDNMQSFDSKFDSQIKLQYEGVLDKINSANNYELSSVNGPITTIEMKRALQSVSRSGKSFDNNGFHPAMWNHIGPVAFHYLVTLFNVCLEQGIWPWSDSHVIFIRKTGKPSYVKPGTYRLITISSYIGKLLEKILSRRIEVHLKSIGWCDLDQEGFTKNKNTARYLNRLDWLIKWGKQNKKTVIGLFIDFEKAFDSVWKKGLVVKLFDKGIQGNFLKLIISFLISRTVNLKVNSHTGPCRHVGDFGLPQGSALSPMLFKFYINDLMDLKNLYNQQVGPSIHTLKFADDATILILSEDTSSGVNSFRTVCLNLENWCSKWKMIINCNTNKTEYMVFSTAEKDQGLIPVTFQIGQRSIKKVNVTCVLGLHIDSDLTFKHHSSVVHNCLLLRWITILRNSNKHWGLNYTVMTRLIKVLFLPCLFYGGMVWINQHNLADINKLWYKVLKSTLGATFNVKLELCEIISGLPPIVVQNSINSIKHFLKLNIKKDDNDPLRMLINKGIQPGPSKDLHGKLQQVFKFLQWKLMLSPECFTASDQIIVEENIVDYFADLSSTCCSYTKSMVKEYTEKLWQNSVQISGY